MTVFENECVGCTSLGLPCIGSCCPNRNVERHYCDECGKEEDLFEVDGLELCASCLRKEGYGYLLFDEDECRKEDEEEAS